MTPFNSNTLFSLEKKKSSYSNHVYKKNQSRTAPVGIRDIVVVVVVDVTRRVDEISIIVIPIRVRRARYTNHSQGLRTRKIRILNRLFLYEIFTNQTRRINTYSDSIFSDIDSNYNDFDSVYFGSFQRYNFLSICIAFWKAQ